MKTQVSELQMPFAFGTAPERVDPLTTRRKAMQRVLDKAGEAFKQAFSEFVLFYLATHGPSDGETIRAAYEQTAWPKPHKWQAAGGVYAKLRRDGYVVEIGKVRSKKFGNDIAVIQLVK